MNNNFAENYHNLAYNEKKNFLFFIFNLGENKLKRLFKFPGENFSFWWFSLIAEKPPFKSDAYEKLISFLLARDKNNSPDKLKKSEIKSVIAYIIRGLHSLLYRILHIIRIKIFLKDFKKRRSSLDSKKYIIVSYFPLLDKTKAAKNIFENRYIAPFHRLLDEKNKNEYAHICLQTKIDGYSFREALDLTNNFNQHQTLLFVEEFVKPSYLFLFSFYYLYFLFIFIFNLKVIKKSCFYSYKGKTYDIWHILNKDFYKSFCGENLVSSIWFILLFRELTKCLNKNSKIISICEMQWWEKALYIFAKKQRILTVGFQHSIVPELLLNYFNIAREINGNNFVEKCPLPDYLATVGDIPAKLFIKYGWPKEKVFVWGAQRFESLNDANNFPIAWKERRDYFVCALSIDSREMQRILLLLGDAFKEPLGYKIILKNHPAAINIQEMVNRLNLGLNPNIFEFSDDSIGDLLKWAKGIIVTESSSTLYALIYNVPIIVPRFPDKLDCNPLSYISSIPRYVYEPQQLREACDEIVHSDNPPVDIDVCKLFLKEYLYFPNTDNEYLEKINCLVN